VATAEWGGHSIPTLPTAPSTSGARKQHRSHGIECDSVSVGEDERAEVRRREISRDDRRAGDGAGVGGFHTETSPVSRSGR
jgi:hypothetical protein